MDNGSALYFIDYSNYTFDDNITTTNASDDIDSMLTPFTMLETAIISVILGLMILCTIFGNLMVIMAIVIERDLQRTQYYLILSLAVADLLVGVAVSPFAAIYDLHKQWHLGVYMCDFWTCMDVLACTSSILHLVAIALDRYWSITDITYMQKRTPKRILIMIMIVWVVSLVISVAPVLGWKDNGYYQRVANRECLISQHIAYQLFSTTAAFYGPLFFIILLYWQIYKAARHRIRLQQKRRAAALDSMNGKQNLDRVKSVIGKRLSLLTPPVASSMNDIATDACSTYEPYSTYSADNLDSPELPVKLINGITPDNDSEYIQLQSPVVKTSSANLLSNGSLKQSSNHNHTNNSLQKRKKHKKESLESKRERRAGRTLAIITGLFIVCWVPFFVLAVFRPICDHYYNTACHFPPALQSVFQWLGYLNSALNPILYTIFSPDFRQAFKKILKRLWYLLN